MLKSLKIRNFRGLENFEVARLGRVNLIVGKNNSGKSSVLEALRIYAGNAQLGLLETIAEGHDEKSRSNDAEFGESDIALPFEDFFTGRRFPEDEGTAIEIGDPLSDGAQLWIEHGLYVDSRVMVAGGAEDGLYQIRHDRIRRSDIAAQTDELPRHALFVQKGARQTMLRFDLLRSRSMSSASRARVFDPKGTIPCSVIPTQFLGVDELADEWDKIALTDNQAIVFDALRIISPEFEALTFVRKDDNYRSGRDGLSRSAKVKLAHHERLVPLNSLGDGMLRLLQLLLKIFPAKGGFLLIDEFENGLHYAVQEKIWAVVFDLAEKLDIQVFATTHSWDCIESFSKVAIARKDIEGVLFRVGRSARTSEQGRTIATVFDEEQLFGITQADLEVR